MSAPSFDRGEVLRVLPSTIGEVSMITPIRMGLSGASVYAVTSARGQHLPEHGAGSVDRLGSDARRGANASRVRRGNASWRARSPDGGGARPIRTGVSPHGDGDVMRPKLPHFLLLADLVELARWAELERQPDVVPPGGFSGAQDPHAPRVTDLIERSTL